MPRMPKILKCEVDVCSFNRNYTCHAKAVTIGNAWQGRCETFCHLTTRGGESTDVGVVGACKAQQCQYNLDLECQRSEITISYKAQGPCCHCLQLRKAELVYSR